MSQLSVKKLKKRGIPESVALRLWEKKTLWLIVMHKDDISKIHIADLRGKFQYDNTFDIVEMRAIWVCTTFILSFEFSGYFLHDFYFPSI